MTAISVILGVTAGIGVFAAVVALLPAAPVNLVAFVARVDSRTIHPELPIQPHWGQRLLADVARVSAHSDNRWWGIPVTDLAVLEQTATGYVARRLIYALIGGITTAAVALRTNEALMLPAAVVGAALVSLVPWYSVRHAAVAARVEFLHATAVLCDLTAQERDVGRAPGQAVTIALTVADGWVFARIRSSVRSALRLGSTPWEAISSLATEVGVGALKDLADVIASAADGAAISATLRAKAASLRSAALHAETAAANSRSEWLFAPVVLLVVGLLVLLLYPIFAHMPHG